MTKIHEPMSGMQFFSHPAGSDDCPALQLFAENGEKQNGSSLPQGLTLDKSLIFLSRAERGSMKQEMRKHASLSSLAWLLFRRSLEFTVSRHVFFFWAPRTLKTASLTESRLVRDVAVFRGRQLSSVTPLSDLRNTDVCLLARPRMRLGLPQ